MKSHKQTEKITPDSAFYFGQTKAFINTNFRNMSYNPKYCPLIDVLSSDNFSELTPETIQNFILGAKEAMKINQFSRPCCR